MAGDDEEGSITSDDGAAAQSISSEEELPNRSSEDKVSRVDNAKAFFRALNAGADVQPNEFGLNVGTSSGERGACPSCKALDDQRAMAEAKATESEKLYKRMAADFENYKKRIDRERDEFQDLGILRGIKEILPALDDLDRAQSHFDENSDPRSVLESLTLLYNRFLKCFEQLGVKPLEVIGEPFDPRMHEPVQQVEINDIPEGHIAGELRRGYSFKDKIVRPALVNVATPVVERTTAPQVPADRSDNKGASSQTATVDTQEMANVSEAAAGDATQDASRELDDSQNQEEIDNVETMPKKGEEPSETVV